MIWRPEGDVTDADRLRGRRAGGLYFAIQMKRRDPSHRIAVFERNGPDDTFGWGVVFSDETLRNLEGADPRSKQEILEASPTGTTSTSTSRVE